MTLIKNILSAEDRRIVSDARRLVRIDPRDPDAATKATAALDAKALLEAGDGTLEERVAALTLLTLGRRP